MTISKRIEAARRERRVLTRVSRAAWRLEQAERERTWALVSARAEGISIRKLAAAAGLSPSRVHQLVADADLDALDAALGELRAAGWPAPEDPDSGEDTELGGRDSIAGQARSTPRHAPDQAPSVQDQLMAGFVLTLAVPHQGPGVAGRGPGHGVQAHRVSARPLARRERTSPRRLVRAGAHFEGGQLIERPDEHSQPTAA